MRQAKRNSSLQKKMKSIALNRIFKQPDYQKHTDLPEKQIVFNFNSDLNFACFCFIKLAFSTLRSFLNNWLLISSLAKIRKM